MAAYATFGDLNTVYESAIPDADRPRLEALLRRASRRIDQIVPSVPYRLANGELDPDLPAGLVIEAVLRVYRNPEGVTQDQMGPFSKQFNPRGVSAEVTFDEPEVHLYLDPLPSVPSSFRLGMPLQDQVLDEARGFTLGDVVQTVTVTGAPTGGSFTLTLNRATTAPISYNATAATVAAVLNALAPDNLYVTVSGDAGGPWTVTFADTDVASLPLMTADSALTGGTSPAVTVTGSALPLF